MKRIAALLLAFVMLLSLIACDSNSRDRDRDRDRDSGKNRFSFTEMTAVDNDECLIKITDVYIDDTFGFALKTYLENKSTDKTYIFTVDSVFINGVQGDSLFYAEVSPEKKANEDIFFSTEELEQNGVGDFTDIELTFSVSDNADWSADPVATETVHVYPYGEDKAVQFVREPQDTDIVLVDNEYVSVIVTGYNPNGYWGYTVNLFLINKTDKKVMFSADDVSVNGFMLDPFYGESLAGGKCAFSSMSWFEEEFDENDITDVEEIEFTFRARDYEDWLADDFVNESITLNP